MSDTVKAIADRTSRLIECIGDAGLVTLVDDWFQGREAYDRQSVAGFCAEVQAKEQLHNSEIALFLGNTDASATSHKLKSGGIPGHLYHRMILEYSSIFTAGWLQAEHAIEGRALAWMVVLMSIGKRDRYPKTPMNREVFEWTKEIGTSKSLLSNLDRLAELGVQKDVEACRKRIASLVAPGHIYAIKLTSGVLSFRNFAPTRDRASVNTTLDIKAAVVGWLPAFQVVTGRVAQYFGDLQWRREKKESVEQTAPAGRLLRELKQMRERTSSPS